MCTYNLYNTCVLLQMSIVPQHFVETVFIFVHNSIVCHVSGRDIYSIAPGRPLNTQQRAILYTQTKNFSIV